MFDNLKDRLRRGAIPRHDGEQRIEHLLLPRLVAFPSGGCPLTHGEIDFEGECSLLVFVCRALKGRCRNAR